MFLCSMFWVEANIQNSVGFVSQLLASYRQLEKHMFGSAPDARSHAMHAQLCFLQASFTTPRFTIWQAKQASEHWSQEPAGSSQTRIITFLTTVYQYVRNQLLLLCTFQIRLRPGQKTLRENEIPKLDISTTPRNHMK